MPCHRIFNSSEQSNCLITEEVSAGLWRPRSYVFGAKEMKQR